MSRTFAYARVSTIDQETRNQIAEIGAAGFKVEAHRIITETISGSVAIAQRPEFARLLDKMEQGDVLIVTKFDRLGQLFLGKLFHCASSFHFYAREIAIRF